MGIFLKRFGLTSSLALALTLFQGTASAGENALFGYPHLLSSPYTLPAGTLIFGTDVAYGVTDFLQVGTQLLSNFYKVYNANAKISFIDYPDFAFALTGGWQRYNYKDIAVANPDVSVESWQPGVVTAVAVLPSLAWFVGGNLNFTQATLITDSIVTSGYTQGAAVESDLAFAYNPKKKRIGNVLSAGVSYDLTYKLLGVGISHHWPGFHFGVHYYPAADQYPLRPIIAGGGTMQF